jgi:hypothetical protein
MARILGLQDLSTTKQLKLGSAFIKHSLTSTHTSKSENQKIIYYRSSVSDDDQVLPGLLGVLALVPVER